MHLQWLEVEGKTFPAVFDDWIRGLQSVGRAASALFDLTRCVISLLQLQFRRPDRGQRCGEGLHPARRHVPGSAAADPAGERGAGLFGVPHGGGAGV